MSIKCFTYKNTSVQIKKVKPVMNAICFCCGEEIDEYADAISLVNEQNDMPSIILHEKCFIEQSNNLLDLYNDVCIAFKQYEKLDKIFRTQKERITKK